MLPRQCSAATQHTNQLFTLQNYYMQLQQSRPISEKYAIIDSQLLGKGSTGNVYQGFLLSSPQARVAIKAIDLRDVDNEVTRYLLSCEIAALSNLGKLENSAHENVVRLLDVVLQDNYIYLVTELLEGGTLSQYLKRTSGGLPEEEAVLIFRQMLEGYRQIRSKAVVHRDLKPDNVLFKTKPQVSKKVAIIDFGYCEMAEVPNKPQMYYNVGSPKYMAPEAYVDNLYSQKSDIWALGVIFYEMLVGRTCDQGLKMEAYLDMIRKNGIPLPNHLSPFAKHVLTKMLTFSYQARVDCLQILRDFQSYQSSFQSHQSQTLLRSNQFNQTTASGFLAVRQNKQNEVFKSALLGQHHPPHILAQSQMQPNIIINEVPTNIPPEGEDKVERQGRFMKNNSARNVKNQIAFNLANNNGPILTRMDNIHPRETQKNKITEIKNTHNNVQTINMQSLDTSFPTHKVHFNVIPFHGQLQTQNQSIREQHSQPQSHQHQPQNQYQHQPHHQLHPHQRDQRFMSNNNNPDENSVRISIIPRQHRYPGILSIQKRDNRAFHSPTRKETPKIQFYTEKKLRDSDDIHSGKLIEVRHVREVRQVREGRQGQQNYPVFGLVPLFH